MVLFVLDPYFGSHLEDLTSLVAQWLFGVKTGLLKGLDQLSLLPNTTHFLSVRISQDSMAISEQSRSYFLSAQNSPQNTHPLVHVYFPLPVFLSNLQQPSQTSPINEVHTPLPCLQPSKNSPSQVSPLAQAYLPLPWNLPFEYSPLYESSLWKDSVPKPSLTFYTNVPSYVLWSSMQKQPKPSFLPFLHSPQQLILLCASQQRPLPLLSPSAHCPSQKMPEHWIMSPLPLRLPFKNRPRQQYLSGIYYMPSPDLSISAQFHSPMQSLPLQCQTSLLCNCSKSNIMQFLYFFITSRCASPPTYTPSAPLSSRISSAISQILIIGLGGSGILGIQTKLKDSLLFYTFDRSFSTFTLSIQSLFLSSVVIGDRLVWASLYRLGLCMLEAFFSCKAGTQTLLLSYRLAYLPVQGAFSDFWEEARELRLDSDPRLSLNPLELLDYWKFFLRSPIPCCWNFCFSACSISMILALRLASALPKTILFRSGWYDALASTVLQAPSLVALFLGSPPAY